MTAPKISVLIPTKNRPRLLAQALASLMEQDFEDFEVIVVNDGGKDISQVVELVDLDIKVLSHIDSQDVPCSLNLAFHESKGDYIAICDDDDIYHPRHLQELYNALKQNPTHQLAYTDVQAFQKNLNQVVGLLAEPFNKDRFKKTNYVCPSSVLIKRDLVETLNGFDEALARYHDWDFFLRALKHTDFLRVPQVLTYYRIHNQSVQSTFPKHKRQIQLEKLCAKHGLGKLEQKHLFDLFNQELKTPVQSESGLST